MTQVVIDPTTQAKLMNMEQPLEIRDESGRVLGYFTPAEDTSWYKSVEPPVTEEELQNREQEAATGECLTTAEVLDHLKKL